MTRTMERLWTTKELYPPQPVAEVAAALAALLTDERDRDSGRCILRREATAVERAAMRQRRDALTPWARSSSYRDVQAVVMAMFHGFTQWGASEEESGLQAMQYSYALAGLPIWAVKRACDAFAQGRVEVEEVGARSIDKGRPPSSAQLHTIARKFLLPVQQEMTRLDAALHGMPRQRELTGAERERAAAAIAAKNDEFKAEMANRRLEDMERDKVQSERRVEEARKRGLEMVLREYDGQGLPRPEPGPSGTVTSLSMLLRLGWTVQDVGGRRVLVQPRKEMVR